MTFQTYSLTRVIDGGHAEFAQSFTTSDDDAINCAHMLAAGFNTMSRNMLSGWVLAVVDTKDGRVFYDDKAEQIRRDTPSKPGVYEQTFKFEPSVDADTIVSLLSGGGGNGMFSAFGKVDVQSAGPYEAPSKYAHVARSVLEAAYVELHRVKDVLFDAGVETIPADAGVKDLLAVKRDMSEKIAMKDKVIIDQSDRLKHEFAARTAMEKRYGDANEAARAELIEHVKCAYAKWGQVDPGRQRAGLKSHLRGMIEILSKYLVAIGEADADERHAVALRVCGIPEGSYLYDEQ